MRFPDQKIKILFSARDPAAAQAIKNIVLETIQIDAFIVCVVCCGPAVSILDDIDCDVRILDSDRDISFYYSSINDLFYAFKPTVTVSGSSGPDIGIDEILIKAAQSINSYVVQDFWGDVNLYLGAAPSCYFVLDDFAAKQTKEKVDSDTFVTGSIKHFYYKDLDINALRKMGRKELKVEHNTTLIGFFGMPLEFVDGYWGTIKALHPEIMKISENRSIKFIYRPHPKESSASITRTCQLLNTSGVDFILDQHFNIDCLLASCDLVLSCYSSCGIDAELLSQSLDNRGPLSVFLLFEKDVLDYYKEYTLLDDIPISLIGRAITIKTRAQLSYELKKYLSADARAEFKSKVNDVALPTKSVPAAIEKIMSDLNLIGN